MEEPSNSTTPSPAAGREDTFGCDEKDLLQVSQFLTRFGAFFGDGCTSKEATDTSSTTGSNTNLSQEGEEEHQHVHMLVGPITPQDVQESLEYRCKLERIQYLKDVVYVWQRLNNTGQENAQGGKDYRQCLAFQELQKLQANLDLTDPAAAEENDTEDNRSRRRQEYRRKLIYTLWERFTVWTTKALVQHVFLSHNHHKTATITEAKSGVYCWSKLLNLPTASYSSAKLPAVPSLKVANRHDAAWSAVWNKVYDGSSSTHPCSLMLPPCQDTWLEYSRMAYMVALLPDCAARDEAHTSPCTGDGWDRNKEMMQTKFTFAPPDLVALWIRAQRNTQAARHLVQIFTIVATINKNDPPKYTAIFRGNYEGMYKRVTKESPLVDALIEWAVTNQVLFTQQWVRNALKQPPLLRHRKRNALNDNSRPCKKLKSPAPANEDGGLDEWCRTELSRSCQKHFLRWWARRNRPTTEILFFRNPAAVLSAQKAGLVVHPLTARLAGFKIMELIRANLNTPDCEFTDRTFVRIDRRIALGKYDVTTTVGNDHDNNMTTSNADTDPRECPFYMAVHRLLVALLVSVADLKMDTTAFQAAVDDFDFYLTRFLALKNEAGMVAAARSLLDPSCNANVVAPCDLAVLVSSLAPPWVDLCAICNKTVLEEGLSTTSFKMCSCCDTVVHNSCVAADHGIAGTGTDHAKSFVESCPYLREMYSIQLPNDVSPPDFRGDRSSELTWTMKALSVTRRLGKDGKLEKYGIQLRHTEETAELLDQLLGGSRLISQIPGEADYAVGVKKTGLLVVANCDLGGDNSCGKSAGILPGDVIVAMQFLEIDTSDANVTLVKNQCYSFPKMSRSDRFKIFQCAATKVRIVVERPSKKIIEESSAWRDSICRSNEVLKFSLDENKCIWFCSDCRAAANPEERIEEGKARAYREAKLCRAVVRRLGMEAHGIPFLDEDRVSSDIAGSQDQSLPSQISLRRLDCMMDWIISLSADDNNLSAAVQHSNLEDSFFVSGKRLDWAPKELEARPFELICRGMSRLSRVYSLPVQSPGAVTRAAIDEHRALISHFLRIFCAWCLAPDQPSCRSSGPGLHAVYARAPIKPGCESFLVRPLSEPHAGRICDFSCSSDPDISDRPDSYETCAALVGATVLLLRGDPILKGKVRVLGNAGARSKHLERPVELLVVSYLPSSVERQNASKASASDGTYHLLPVADQQQLEFLLGKCQERQSLSLFSDGNLHSWASRMGTFVAGLLNLGGVVQLSFSELRYRLQQTSEMHDAMTAEVARQAQCACGESQRSTRNPEERCVDENSKRGPCTNVDCRLVSSQAKRLGRTEAAPTCKDKLVRASTLIDGLAIAGSPVFCEMMKSSGVSPRPENADPNHMGTEANNKDTGGLDLASLPVICEMTKSSGVSLQPENSDPSRMRMDANNEDTDCLDLAYHAAPDSFPGKYESYTGQASSSDYPLSRIPCMQQTSQTKQTALASLQGQRQTMYSSLAAASSTASFSKLVSPMRSTGQASSLSNPLARSSILPQNSQLAPAELASPQGKSQSLAVASGTAASSTQMSSNGCASSPDCALGRTSNPPQLGGISIPTVCTADNLPVIRELLEIYFGNRLLREHDLYHGNGIPGTVLTRAETSLLLEAIKKGYPMLGLRMLCPRYELSTIVSQLNVLSQHDLASIPLLPRSVWSYLIRADYNRQQKEPPNGEIRFRDPRCAYPMPTEIFQVDYFCKLLWHRNDREARPWSELSRVDTSSPHLEDSDPAPGASIRGSIQGPLDFSRRTRENNRSEGRPPDRIRVGGGMNSQAQEQPLSIPDSTCLTVLPRSTWHNAYVYSFCETARENMLIGKARCIGQVHYQLEGDNESGPVGEVPVHVFYLSNVGLFLELEVRTFDPQNLYVVAQDSQDSHIVSTWEKLSQEASLPIIDAKIHDKGLPTIDPVPPGESDDEPANKTTPADKLTTGQDPFPFAGRLSIEPRGTTTRHPSAGSVDLGVSVEHENNPYCSVCSLGTECVLLQQDVSAQGATNLYRGIGCAMMSEFCFGINRPCLEQAGRAKQMLLSLADKIPLALRRLETADSGPSATRAGAHLGPPLSSTLDVWRSFVLESRSLLSLSQALLLLVSGLDCEKLPPWWRSESAGWGKPQMLLTRPSHSNICLLIRVLDLAVTEFKAAGTDGTSH